MTTRYLKAISFYTLFLILFQSKASTQSAESFFAVFPNWLNAKITFGAKGDGKADDSKALQTALDSLVNDKSSRVLYLPAGTYRITKTITIFNSRNFYIMGEDPLKTIIVWDGATDGNMIIARGVGAFRIGRMTLDGTGRANHGLWHVWEEGGFPSNMEDGDMVFKNLKTGIQGGEYPTPSGKSSTAAEATVIRCSFVNCTKGVVLDDFNTVDWWIRQCLFEDNVFGVYVEVGTAGVYNCVFKRSSATDIYMAHDDYPTIRNNYSINSRRFFEYGGPSNWNARVDIQGNTILEGTSPLQILIPNPGPIQLIDNVICGVAEEVEPVIHAGTLAHGDVLSVGNTFTVSIPFAIDTVNNRFISIDDTIVNRKTIKVSEPILPSTPPLFNGPIIEVAGFSDKSIQEAINVASKKYPGKHPIVHLKFGDYIIKNTIAIPAGSDLTLMGDVGYLADAGPGATRLIWQGKDNGTVVHIQGPSHARMQDLHIQVNDKADGIVLDNVDQPGSRVFVDQMNVNAYSNSAKGIALFADGLDNTVIEGWHVYVAGEQGAVVVTGGPKTARGELTTARLDIFGGNGGSYNNKQLPLFDVRKNGRLMIQDFWFETGGPRPPVIKLTGQSAGTITLQQGKHQYHTKASVGGPTHIVDGFTGKATFLGMVILAADIVLAGNSKEQNALFLGNGFGREGNPIVRYTKAVVTANPATNAVISNSTDEKSDQQLYSDWYPNSGKVNKKWLVSMLKQTRTEKPTESFEALPEHTTDIRMIRVGIDRCINGLHIVGNSGK